MNWKLATNDCVYYKGYLWLSNTSSNGLYRIDTKKYEIKFMGFFPNEKKTICIAHKKVFAYDDKLIFLPAYASHIHIYSIDTGKFEAIYFESSRNGEKILDAVKIDNILYIFMADGKCTLKAMNLENNQINNVDEFSKQMSVYLAGNERDLYYCCESKMNEIYFGIKGTDKIACWNVKTNLLKTFSTGIEDIHNLIFSKDRFFFTKYRGNKIYSCDLTGLAKEEQINDEPMNLPDVPYYGRLFSYKDKVWSLPAFSNNILVREENGFNVVCSLDNYEGLNYKLFGAVVCDNELWMPPCGLIYDFYICESEKDIKKIKPKISTDDCQKLKIEFLREFLSENNIVVENPDSRLDYFLKL